MKELIRFRQFLTEGKINEEREGQDKLDALEAALTDQHAKNVISSGRFTTIDTFGNGEDVTPLKNVTKELEEELGYLKNNDMVDTDEYDDASDDLEAAQEIAQVVKKMGGEVAYGGDGLMYVYSVNSKGDLLGQTIATDGEIGGSSFQKNTPKGFAFIFRTNAQGKEQFEQAKAILQNQGISFEEDSEMNGQIALNFSGTQDVRDLKQMLGDNGVGRFTIGNVGQYK